MLTLHREVDVAMVEAQVLENAETMLAVPDNGKSESEKVKILCTNEYVQSQINLKNCLPSLRLSVSPTNAPFHTKSHDSFVTWHPPVKEISQFQPIYNKTQPEKAQPALIYTKLI